MGRSAKQTNSVIVNNDPKIPEMRTNGIDVQIGTYSLHVHPAFPEDPRIIHRGSFDGSRYAYDHGLTLPLYHDLSEGDQRAVVEMLKGLLVKLGK